VKVLFISSGNSQNGVSQIIKAQGESLREQNIEVNYFLINGKGFFGYVRNIIILREYLSTRKYDLIHAHYGLAGIVALLAIKKNKLVVSFMGDDIMGSNNPDGSLTIMSLNISKLNSFLAKSFYDFVIVKSIEMHKQIQKENSYLIPNGVNISIFKPTDKSTSRKILKIDHNKKIVLFVSNPERVEKNFSLAQKALRRLNIPDTELITVYNKSQTELIDYYNAADVSVLTSFHEGSPNVIKEAMACNCPIVSTDVGDVSWVLGNTEGCYIAGFDPKNFAGKLKQALAFASKIGRTKGRDRIIELGLDSETVAKRIIGVYERVLGKRD
jgi:teichuronic acid biosynthesis glycosyltransferase TuaC